MCSHIIHARVLNMHVMCTYKHTYVHTSARLRQIIHVCVIASYMYAYLHQHVDVCVLASYMNVHLNLHVCARFRRICACVREDNACTNACVQYVCACVHAMHTHK